MSDQKRALTAGVALLERAIDYALGSLRIVTPPALCRPTPCTGWNLQQLLAHLGDSLQTLDEAATGHILLAQSAAAPTARQATIPATPPAVPGTTGTPAMPCPRAPGTPTAGSRTAGTAGGLGSRTASIPAPGPQPAPPVRAAGVPAPGSPPAPPVRAEGIPAPGTQPPPPVQAAGALRPAAQPTPAEAAKAVASGPRPEPALQTPNPALLLRDSATEVLGRWAALSTADLVTVHDRHLTSPMVAAAGAIEITVHAWDVAMASGEPRPIPPHLAEDLLDLAHLFVTNADRPARFARPVILPMYAPTQDHLLAHLGRHPDWPAHD
ncbi:maleylpyruvate isomerase N-terminal domain-containing protein [[Actinomadura] parvosata]|uniref:maleylpyruvate isomerase N-terminal domain-containing protein n=1 Tax=[Actinomadura] parvosata TaxID=1955412 RepID=UPI00406CB96B